VDIDVLDDIAFAIDRPALRRLLHLPDAGADADTVARLADDAERLGRPKAIVRLAYVEARTPDTVVIGGVTFRSRVLRVNLDAAHRVWAYLGTCGTELEAWSKTVPDVFERYWADAIKEAALGQALQAADAHIRRQAVGKTASMNPGSLPDWPMDQQRPLFDLLGDPTATVGVELTDSFLMVPNKSISGLRFPTEVGFESCQLCPREACPGRRAPYDKDLYAKRFAPEP